MINISLSCRFSSNHSIISSPNIVFSNDITRDFLYMFKNVSQDILEMDEEYKDIKVYVEESLRTCLYYNVPRGNKLSGLLVPAAYNCFTKKEGKELEMAKVLGWCIELVSKMKSCIL